MVFTCERRDRCGDVGEGGVEVAAGHAGRGVSGKGLGDGVAGDAPDTRDGGVAEHVSRNRDAFVPAEAVPGTGEQPVVATPGDRFASSVPEHGIARIVASALAGVCDRAGDERGRGRLFALGVVLLPEPHGGPGGVDVAASEVEGALASGAGLEVEPDEQQVEVRVGAGGPDGVGEVGELPVVEGPSSARRAQGLPEGGGGVGGDVAGVDGAGVEGAEGGDAGLPGRPASRVGAVGPGTFGCCVDHGGEVGGGELGQVPVAQQGSGEAPVGAVGRRRRRAKGRGDLVDPGRDCDRHGFAGGGGEEVADIESEGAGFLEQDPGTELAVHRTRSRSWSPTASNTEAGTITTAGSSGAVWVPMRKPGWRRNQTGR